MDLPEGRQALREIKALEDGIELRLKEVRQQAQEMVSRARAEAEERIRLKEGELARLRCRLDAGTGGAEDAGSPLPAGDLVTDRSAVTALARELLNVITGR